MPRCPAAAHPASRDEWTDARRRVFVPVHAMRLVVSPCRIPTRQLWLRRERVEKPLRLRPLRRAEERPELVDDAKNVSTRACLPPIDVHRGVTLGVWTRDGARMDDRNESPKDGGRAHPRRLSHAQLGDQVALMCAVTQEGTAALAVVEAGGPRRPSIVRRVRASRRTRSLRGRRKLRKLHRTDPARNQLVQRQHVPAARNDPAIEVAPTGDPVGSTDRPDATERALKSQQGVWCAVDPSLVDARHGSLLETRTILDQTCPSLAVEEPSRPRQLVSIHRREREHTRRAAVKA